MVDIMMIFMFTYNDICIYHDFNVTRILIIMVVVVMMLKYCLVA